MQLITLGTQAGPAIRGKETGIASAIVVGDHFYMVDFGLGCTRAAHEAGLRGHRFRAGFLTHLHSDHIVELPGFLLWNWGNQVAGFIEPIKLVGPGPDPTQPGPATTGTAAMLSHFLQAFSYDVHVRTHDEGRPSLEDLVNVTELNPPPNTHGPQEPFPVFEDARIRVTGIVVDHPPVYPALAFRVESEAGSITFSGDTAESPALARLAQDTDILVHEAVNLDFYVSQDFNREFVTHQHRSHTTPEGAGRVAAAAGARTLVLSHLAGTAPPGGWRSRAATTFSGQISVATSGASYTIDGSTKREAVNLSVR